MSNRNKVRFHEKCVMYEPGVHSFILPITPSLINNRGWLQKPKQPQGCGPRYLPLPCCISRVQLLTYDRDLSPFLPPGTWKCLNQHPQLHFWGPVVLNTTAMTLQGLNSGNNVILSSCIYLLSLLLPQTQSFQLKAAKHFLTKGQLSSVP